MIDGITAATTIRIITANFFQALADLRRDEAGQLVYYITAEDGQFVDAEDARELAEFFDMLADELEAVADDVEENF